MNYDITSLIETLKSLRDEYGEDVELRIATQPNYPLAFHVANVSFQADKKRVFICASQGNCYEDPYAPAQAWENDEFESDDENE